MCGFCNLSFSMTYEPSATHLPQHFYLVPTDHTLALADHWPGKENGVYDWPPMSRVPGHRFQQTWHYQWQQMVVRSLATHPARGDSESSASFCVIASSRNRRSAHCENWNEICRGKRLVVVDSWDANMLTERLCTSLWDCHAQELRDPPIVRITGNAPLVSRPEFGCGFARQGTLTIPYLAHARVIATAYTRRRTVRIAFGVGTVAHDQANSAGFNFWRHRLRDACIALNNLSLCTRAWPRLNGNNAIDTMKLYTNSVFCLQPPGKPHLNAPHF